MIWSSGGPRDSLIALTVAATISRDEIDEVFFRSDLNSELRQIDLPGIGFDLDQKDTAVLNEIKEEGKKVSEIVEKTDLSQSTIYRRLGSLEEQNLLKEEDGEYILTLTGDIVTDSET